MPISKRTVHGKSKGKTIKPKNHGKVRSRQFYAEISAGKGAGKKKSKRPGAGIKLVASKKRSRKSTPRRELLAEISKVGKTLKRRVKRAL